MYILEWENGCEECGGTNICGIFSTIENALASAKIVLENSAGSKHYYSLQITEWVLDKIGDELRVIYAYDEIADDMIAVNFIGELFKRD